MRDQIFAVSLFMATGMAGATEAATGLPFTEGETWSGVATCSGRSVEVSLQLKSADLSGGSSGASNQRLRGTFNLMGPVRGSYGVQAEQSGTQPDLAWAPHGFFSLPPGWTPAPLQGRFDATRTLLQGRMVGNACSSFALLRTLKGAPASPATSAAPIIDPRIAQEPALSERFVLRDAAVVAAMTLPCTERPQMLLRLAQRFSQPSAGAGEAAVALLQLEGSGECGQHLGSPMTNMLAQRHPAALAAWQRTEARPTLATQWMQTLATYDELVAKLPKPATPAPLGPEVPACVAEPGLFDSMATAMAFEKASASVAPRQLMWLWAARHFGGPLLCTRPSQDGHTEALLADWPAIVRAWHAAHNKPATTPLAALDVALLEAQIQNLDMRRHLAGKLAQEEARLLQAAAAAEHKAAQAREQAAERDFKSHLTKSRPAQEVYLRAGRYERSSEIERARQLYEFLTTAHANTPWAVKANDRLLKLADSQRGGGTPGRSTGDTSTSRGQRNAPPMGCSTRRKNGGRSRTRCCSSNGSATKPSANGQKPTRSRGATRKSAVSRNAGKKRNGAGACRAIERPATPPRPQNTRASSAPS